MAKLDALGGIILYFAHELTIRLLCRSIIELDRAMHSEPTCPVECLSLRYSKLNEEAVNALVGLIGANTSIEILYLHLSVLTDKNKEAIAAAWTAHGCMHKITNNGMTLQRKMDTSYLTDKRRWVPQWALTAPPKPKKAAKKGKKKSGNKKK